MTHKKCKYERRFHEKEAAELVVRIPEDINSGDAIDDLLDSMPTMGRILEWQEVEDLSGNIDEGMVCSIDTTEPAEYVVKQLDDGSLILEYVGLVEYGETETDKVAQKKWLASEKRAQARAQAATMEPAQV